MALSAAECRPVSNEVMSVNALEAGSTEHDLIKNFFLRNSNQQKQWSLLMADGLHVTRRRDQHDFEKVKKMNDGGLVTLFLLSRTSFRLLLLHFFQL